MAKTSQVAPWRRDLPEETSAHPHFPRHWLCHQRHGWSVTVTLCPHTMETKNLWPVPSPRTPSGDASLPRGRRQHEGKERIVDGPPFGVEG